jgi:iron complex outermembrane recepter protein
LHDEANQFLSRGKAVKSFDHILAGCATGAALVCLSTTVLAQESAPAETDRGGFLEEVVVTAEKREANVQSVPIAIAAISEQALKDFNVASTNELMNLVPSLNISRVNISSIPFIRGVGHFGAQPGTESSVAIYVDDIYYPSPMSSTFSYNSIERVEVLKGPQGTLFGRNASGGVIHIISKDPGATPEIKASAGVANYETFTGHFYGSMPITDRLGANLAVYAEDQRAPWGHNVVDGSDAYFTENVAARGKLLYTGDDWKVRFTADYNRTRDDATPLLAIMPGTTSINGDGKRGGFYDVDIDYSPSSGIAKQYGASLRVDREFTWGRISSISSGRHSEALAISDLDGTPSRLIEYRNTPEQETWSQEFQVASGESSKWQWVGGLYLYKDDAALEPNQQMQLSFTQYPLLTRRLFALQKTTSVAPFAQVTIPFNDAATNLTLGVRYTKDERELTYRNETVNGAIVSQGGPFKIEWPKTTYRVALDHNFAEDIMGYASVSRGFKSGNYNVGNPTAPPVNPEVVDAYEIGMKTDLFGGRARLNWAAYYYEIKDKQVQQRLTVGNLQTNAATLEHKGIDIDLTVAPTDSLTLIAAVALLDAEYASFPNSTFYFPCTTTTSGPGCNASVNGGGYYLTTGDSTGLRPHYAEEAVGTLSARYEVPVGEGRLQFVGSAAYHDGFFFDVQNIAEQPSYTLLDANVTWTAPSGKYDVTLWGKNLGSEEYFSQQQLYNLVYNYAVQPPRTYGLTFGYYFN